MGKKLETIDKGCPECHEDVIPTMVGSLPETSGECYVSKHGLKIHKTEGMSNAHFRIFCDLADKDPNIMVNMAMGRYMPRQNGFRLTYRGRDRMKYRFGKVFSLILFIFVIVFSLYAIGWVLIEIGEQLQIP